RQLCFSRHSFLTFSRKMWSTFWIAAELATMESRRTQSDLMEPTFPIRVKTQSMLGVAQKAWFLRALLASSATWKLWGNSVGVLDWRLDFQNLPTGFGPSWADSGYATFGDDDWSAYRHERTEILNFIRNKRITGVAAIGGD